MHPIICLLRFNEAYIIGKYYNIYLFIYFTYRVELLLIDFELFYIYMKIAFLYLNVIIL